MYLCVDVRDVFIGCLLAVSVRGTCTGCLWPSYALCQAPARSPSPAEGCRKCGAQGGGAGASSPSIRFDAQEVVPRQPGQGRERCGRTGDFAGAVQSFD